MEQGNFSPQEGLAVIQNMIAKARSNMGDNSKGFLLWGWGTFIAFIGQFLLKHVFSYERHYLVWIIVFPLVLLDIYLTKKQKKGTRATSYIQDSMKHLWLGMGISFFVLTAIFTKMGWGNNVYPFFILLYGLGTFVSGKILQFTPLVAGSVVAWALAIAATFTSYDYQMLCAAAAILASYIIPAYILRQKNKLLNSSN